MSYAVKLNQIHGFLLRNVSDDLAFDDIVGGRKYMLLVGRWSDFRICFACTIHKNATHPGGWGIILSDESYIIRNYHKQQDYVGARVNPLLSMNPHNAMNRHAWMQVLRAEVEGIGKRL